MLSKIPGVLNVNSKTLVDSPTRTIAPRAASLDLTRTLPSDLVDAVAAAQQGLAATDINATNGFRVPVVLVAPGRPGSSAHLSDTPIWGKGKRVWPLSALASITRSSEPASITHEGGRRMISVSINTESSELSSVAAAVMQTISGTALPADVTWQMAGQASERARAGSRLLLIALVVLCAILAFLALAFHSLTDAVVIVAGIPIGLAEGLVAALLLPE